MLSVFWKIHSGQIGCKCVVSLGFFSRRSKSVQLFEKTVRFVNVNNVLFCIFCSEKELTEHFVFVQGAEGFLQALLFIQHSRHYLPLV